jgi:phosphatidylglycerophosphate synthase
MIRRARLTEPAAGDPFGQVAGMTILLRQILSLQDAGIDEVGVEGIPAERLPRDPRVRLRLVSLPPTASPPDGEGVLRARLGLVWHRLLPRRLAQSDYAGDLEVAPLLDDEFVIAAAEPRSRRAAEDRLFQSLLKATDGLISRTLNRRISLRVTRALIDTDLTPNQMTLIAGLFGVAAIAVVLWGGAQYLVAGALLVQVQSILDGCDGEISRLKYIRSRVGEWLDQVIDDVVNVGFFVAVGWALYRAGSTIALPVAIAGTAMHIIYQMALYVALITRGGGSGSVANIRWPGQMDPHAPASNRHPHPSIRTVKETLEMTGRRDFFTFLYLPAALLGVTEVALIWCAFIFIASGAVTSLLWLVKGGPLPARRAP